MDSKIPQLFQLTLSHIISFTALTGIETKNKFVIKNSVGQQCFYAYEGTI